tara:strand:+ start:234 stop:1655 length:1422 start_codon:yes stop_codon:yes gene_type:complete
MNIINLCKKSPLNLMCYHIIIVTIFGVLSYIALCFIICTAEKKKEIIKLNNKILYFQKIDTEKELIDMVLDFSKTDHAKKRKEIYSYTNKKGELFGNAKLINSNAGIKLHLLEEATNKQIKIQPNLKTLNEKLPLTAFYQKDSNFLIQAVPIFDGLLILGEEPTNLIMLHSTLKTIAIWGIIPTVFFAIITGKILTFRSTRRIDEINRTLNLLAKGNFSARVRNINSFKDDLLSIVKNINIMAASHETAIESLNQISSDIAHDLKSPIQRVQLSIAEIQNFKYIPNNIDIKLNNIHSEIEVILKIFNSLLEIVQIEGCTLKSSFKKINLTQLTNKCFELYEPFAKKSDHEIIYDIKENNNFFIMGNEELIGQLIVNLLENSINHTQKGTKIKVQLKPYKKSLRLVISDNGPGIPTSYHKKVLDRLYRMEASRTTPGSGLGLSLVNAIAKLHNAKLTLKNNNPGLIVILDFAPK